MAEVHVPDTHVKAGREYLARVRELGLDPEGLFWGQWNGNDAPNLLIVTSLFDRYGPLRIHELLLRAYNASVLPKEISPFIVELHSPAQAIMRDLFAAIGPTKSFSEYGVDGSMRHPNADRVNFEIGPLSIPLSGLYVLEDRRPSRTDVQRRWIRFKRKVDALPLAA